MFARTEIQKSFPASSKVKTLFKEPGLTKISTELRNVQICEKILPLTLWASQQNFQNQSTQRMAGFLFGSLWISWLRLITGDPR